MGNKEPYFIGDLKVAIYVPTRYRNGAPIPSDIVEVQTANCREALAKRFGGCTGVDPTQYIGSFQHDDGRIVDEAIVRVWAKVKREHLESEDCKSAVARIAEDLARDMNQESIAVEWGEQLISFSSAEKKLRFRTVPFASFSYRFQQQMATIAMIRIHSVDRVAEILLLDQWKTVEPRDSSGHEWAKVVAQKGQRKAVVISEVFGKERQRALGSTLRHGDLVFADSEAGAVVVWLKWGDSFRGGREITLQRGENRISRNKLQFCLSILGSKHVERIQDLIDREAVTAKFYRTYRELAERIEKTFLKQGLPSHKASLENQRLLGRLMFLRFLEQKGWLEGKQDYLAQRYRQKKRPYFSTVLEPLFYDILDTPSDKRRIKKDIPYINAGLFRRSLEGHFDLPDSLFDPDVKDSVLDVLRRNDFTLEEFTGSSEISVNPAILGFVLESVCAEQDKKSKGIHYTPPEIANVLAEEGILGRLADLSDLVIDDLRCFAHGQVEVLNEESAALLRDSLFQLRILDPAVGSGSLLLSALDLLMKLFSQCSERLGQPLIRGERAWSDIMRRFIRDSLFGVDIDPLAPEIAKLRLWLALSSGEKSPRPLPDLEYNLRCGDSLSKIDDPEDQIQLGLELDDLSTKRNAFLRALAVYKKADGEAARGAADELAKAEYEYYLGQLEAKGEKPIRRGSNISEKIGSLPFRWAVHFAEVFKGPNRGFDVVITNPPYVRVHNLQRLEERTLDDYEKRFKSLSFGNKDLYLAFIEQALVLAGKAGRIAFIMPNFSRTSSGAPLRTLLSQRRSVEAWVDFGDIQVFKSATNYVALLFGTAAKRKCKTFLCYRPDSENWPPESVSGWLSELPSGKVEYADIWRTGQQDSIKKMEACSIPLGRLAQTIGVGVQTSADEVFLLKERAENSSGPLTVFSDFLRREIPIERGILRRCAKGAKHLKPYEMKSNTFMLWPYSKENEPLEETFLAREYPLAWSYLEKCRKRLGRRAIDKNRFSDRWWQFGRAQGLDLCSSGKILVPSIMKGGTAYLDEKGDKAFTASGKGGGGAWGIVLKQGSIHPRWILAVLNSKKIWDWLMVEGDPKRNGWRGVDKALLERLPIPPACESDLELIIDLTKKLETSLLQAGSTEDLLSQIEELIQKSYGRLGGTKHKASNL